MIIDVGRWIKSLTALVRWAPVLPLIVMLARRPVTAKRQPVAA